MSVMSRLRSFKLTRLEPRAKLIQRIGSYHWAHSIDLGGGLTTPGAWTRPSQDHIRRALDGIDFRGKKVLDIGCWDGLWSFEAERRGASVVYATDDVRQRPHAEQPTLLLARRLLNSSVRYFPNVPVYDVEKLRVRDFDVVIDTGIYYHLRDPLLAFARLRRVMKDGGVILVEGDVKAGDECLAEFFYDRYHAGHPSNWWVPTVPCLRQWITSSYFEIEQEFGPPPGITFDYARYAVIARAVRRRDPHLWGVDDDLHEFEAPGL